MNKWAISFIFVITFLSSCTQPEVILTPSKSNLSKYTFEKSLTKIKKEIKTNPELLKLNAKSKKSLDWYENAASICYFAKDLNLSYKIFDYVDKKINLYEQKLLSDKLVENLASILLNDLVRDYTPPIYERVFVNVYMAKESLLKGDLQKYNINLNRAIERLKYAHTIFEKEMKLENKKDENLSKNKKNKDYKKIKFTKKTLLPIEKEYSSLDAYKPYQDFENPYVYFLKGIYYLYTGENQNAMDMFKTTYGLIKNREKATQVVSKAWEFAKNNKKENLLWIIYLNGLSLEKVEKKFDLPVSIGDAIVVISVALPTLKERGKASDTLYILVENETGKKLYTTKRLVDVDNLIAFEFKKRMEHIIPREIIRAAVKTFLQVEAKKHFGSVGNLIALAYSQATTKADTRQWLWLPKEIQVNVVKLPKDGKVTIYIPNQKKYILNLNNNKSSKIIFVRNFYPKNEVIYYEANLP